MRIPILISGILVAVVTGRASDAHGEPKIPSAAERIEYGRHIVVYHWKVPTRKGDAYGVYAVPKVTNWPKDARGVELTLTAYPSCCGGLTVTARWPRARRLVPSKLIELSNRQRYRITVRVR